MLHESGIAVGRDLIPADEGNAEGYFEERPVVQLNDQIVQTAGLGAWFATASREHMLECAAPLVDEMRALAADATPAWKDPRFSWTLETWLGVLNQAPRIVVCLRNPSEVIGSTMRYYGMEGEEGRRAVAHVWRTETERLLEVIHAFSLAATCVEFDELHQDADNVASRLSRFAGGTVRPIGVRPDLRHHREEPSAEFAELYGRMKALGA